MQDDWDWHSKEVKECTVIRPVRAIAVYTNPAGDLVIRQEGEPDITEPYGKVEDHFVVVPKDRVESIIAAIQKELQAD